MIPQPCHINHETCYTILVGNIYDSSKESVNLPINFLYNDIKVVSLLMFTSSAL